MTEGAGLRRALSNRAHVLVRGCRAPIAGRIAMDMCMADVTGVPPVEAMELVLNKLKKTKTNIEFLLGMAVG